MGYFCSFFPARVRTIIYIRVSRSLPANRPEVRSEVQVHMTSPGSVDVDGDSGRIVGNCRIMAGFRRLVRFVARRCDGQSGKQGYSYGVTLHRCKVKKIY